MIRAALVALGAVWLATGLFVIARPRLFYEATPGLAQMGPFNVHFVRDVGLAFVASGAVTALGAGRGLRALAFAGTAWPVLHALFHVQIWSHRGFPLDEIAAFDIGLVIGPAMLGLWLACRLSSPEGKTSP